MSLPTGQFDLGAMPRYGLPPFAMRLPEEVPAALSVRVGDAAPVDLRGALADVERHTQVSDFHCVTGWSCRAVEWSGWRFADVWTEVLCKAAPDAHTMAYVIFAGADGHAAIMTIEDLLAADVMIADSLGGAPLSMANGAALRLVAPAHYGYKSVKHLRSIRLTHEAKVFREPKIPFLAHPRARVALEERGKGAPAWFLRYLYRPFIGLNIRLFQYGLNAK